MDEEDELMGRGELLLKVLAGNGENLVGAAGTLVVEAFDEDALVLVVPFQVFFLPWSDSSEAFLFRLSSRCSSRALKLLVGFAASHSLARSW